MRRWDPEALELVLGMRTKAAENGQGAAGSIVSAEPVDLDLDKFPDVRKALDNPVPKDDGTVDRSKAIYAVLGACLDAGFKFEKAERVVRSRPDLAEKLDKVGGDDLRRSWIKLVDDQQEHVQITGDAAESPRVREDFGKIAPITLAEGHRIFKKWLGDGYDTDALDAELATLAVEKFDDGSDPIWLLLISGSGNAKTEAVQATSAAGAFVTSSISSDAALLSATPKHERTKGATGGLLRTLGSRGVLAIKDVTSILSMNRDLRAKVLAALREVYDGRWCRDVGTDGGRRIEWKGRIAVIGAVTTAWDTAHAVVASMGDRFVLIRIDSTEGRTAAGRKAIGNTGSEPQMRAELAAAVAGVIAGMNINPIAVTDAETEVLLAAGDLVTLARTAVEFDYKGDVIDAHAPEMPTRFAKQLAQIVRGGVAVGMDRTEAMRLAIRCARDSMPPLRLAIIEDLAKYPASTTSDVRRRINKPRATADRQLQALHMLGVADVDEIEYGNAKTRWIYTLNDKISTAAINPECSPDLSVNTPRPQEERSGDDAEDGAPYLVTDKSGEGCDR